MKARIDWLDILKGIGILAVILGHCVAQSSMPGRLVNSFHMPLFFFISGYLFAPHKTTIATFVAKKLDSLILPYCIYSLLSIGVLLVVDRSRVASSCLSFVKLGGVDVTWFLVCLFWVELIGFLLLIKQATACYALLLAMAAFGIGYAYNCLALPRVCCLRALFYGLSFWLLGYACKVVGLLEKILSHTVTLVGAIALCLVVWLGLFSHQVVVFGAGTIGSPALFVSVSLAAIVGLALVSRKLEFALRWLAPLGRRSLLLMCLHLPVLDMSKALFSQYDFVAPVGAWLRRALSLIFLFLLAEVVYRKMPFLNGKFKLIRR